MLKVSTLRNSISSSAALKISENIYEKIIKEAQMS